MYIGPAAAFELTNPKAMSPARQASIFAELKLGVWAMLNNTGFAVFWMTVVEPHLPFYGFFAPVSEGGQGYEFTIAWLVAGFVVYLLAFDWWFWWTHLVLHWPWCFKHIHAIHHNFVNPTAFAQDAVHPVEGVIQGPAGHYFCALIFPMHPVAHATFGFLTSLYAIAAHDGRAWDISGHTEHHHHKECNFGLYGCFDCLCNTRFRPGYNPTVRGLFLTRWLQFDDVYTRDDLSKAMRKHSSSSRLTAIRDEVTACHKRDGGSPAAAIVEADEDVKAD
jgi:Delta7-sterol 5-desaturase